MRVLNGLLLGILLSIWIQGSGGQNSLTFYDLGSSEVAWVEQLMSVSEANKYCKSYSSSLLELRNEEEWRKVRN